MSLRSELIELQSGVKINAVVSQPPDRNPRDWTSRTVIFLHFWGGSCNTWSFVTPLVSRAYSTVALDFRGWGASTGPDEKTAYSIAALADDVQDVIAALQVKEVVLVGLSMGAKVAQLVAGRMCSSPTNTRAASLRGLVLVSPAPPTPLELPQDMREQQIHAYDNEDSATFVGRNVLSTTFRSRDLPSFVASDMLRGNKWAKEAWPSYAMAEDVSAAIGRVSVPVLILAAAEDTVETFERVRNEVCSRFPEARLEVLSGCGHLSPLDAPNEVAGHLLHFLKTL
jgi:pimeloyl-ACP methyl ester carboxylesterase